MSRLLALSICSTGIRQSPFQLALNGILVKPDMPEETITEEESTGPATSTLTGDYCTAF
jgi:hypothetical protein